jgi:hypothetical protein
MKMKNKEIADRLRYLVWAINHYDVQMFKYEVPALEAAVAHLDSKVILEGFRVGARVRMVSDDYPEVPPGSLGTVSAYPSEDSGSDIYAGVTWDNGAILGDKLIDPCDDYEVELVEDEGGR